MKWRRRERQSIKEAFLQVEKAAQPSGATYPKWGAIAMLKKDYSACQVIHCLSYCTLQFVLLFEPQATRLAVRFVVSVELEE